MRKSLPAIALLATACSRGGTVDAGPVPSRAPATPTTVTTAAASTVDVSVWLVRGETVQPVTRSVPKVPRIGAEAVKALLAGPTPAEAASGLSTAVPSGTRFNDLVVDGDGVAKVDLSRDFETGGGSLGVTLRLAQVTCTVGQFPTVKGVRFALAGQLVSVFSGDGIVLDRPVTCDSYRQVLRPATDTRPAPFAGIWPFATQAELDSYAAGTDKTYRDPVATARAFAAAYLGMADPLTYGFTAAGPGAGDVGIGPRNGQRATFTVSVRQLGAQGATGPWTVVGAASPEIVVAVPAAGDRVASPAHVSGRALAFEGAVSVTLREDGMAAGQSLGKGSVTGGGDQLRPFSGDVAFRAPTSPAGAVAFVELSAADGQVRKATVVRVRFSPPPPTPG